MASRNHRENMRNAAQANRAELLLLGGARTTPWVQALQAGQVNFRDLVAVDHPLDAAAQPAFLAKLLDAADGDPKLSGRFFRAQQAHGTIIDLVQRMRTCHSLFVSEYKLVPHAIPFSKS